MLTRLIHAAISFAIVVVVYQAYVVVAVPLIDPLSNASSSALGAPQPSDRARPATHKYRSLLSAYFPPDHWSLQRPADAAEEVRQAAAYTTSMAGGCGAIREVLELLLKNTDRWEQVLRRYQS